jgi:Family of unknown function (DUF5996)
MNAMTAATSTNGASGAATLWAARPDISVAPTIDHLHRVAQIGGKYTLDQIYEPNWGNIALDVTGRGFATPTVRRGDVIFRVDYDLLDDQVTIAANTGRICLPLQVGSVATFYADFVAAAATLGIPAPGSTIEPEIPSAPRADADDEERPYEPTVASWVATAYASAADALTTWQAPYRGHRPRVGIMWGGFDLAATRYNGQPITPSDQDPMFLRNGMTEEVAAVGFVLGDDTSPANFYAYVSPSPAGFSDADLVVPGARYDVTAGLANLSWDAARAMPDPTGAIVAFGDAVYRVAVELGGWSPHLTLERRDGWFAGKHPMYGSRP